MALPDSLLSLGRDLTAEAREDKIDPIIGRDSEIRNLVKILSLKKKNNPIILGDAGVGKTALVEGLALKIAKEDVPDLLKNKEIFELDLNTLNAFRQRGNLEEIIKTMMQIIKESNGKIILFIDEIHRITGNGQSDLGNLMKPYLARNFGVIGCTTLDEFRFIEKDPALDRRFQKIIVNEPSIDDTISILRGVKTNYEIYHRVTIKDNALIGAVKMTDRYITDKFLPDKALSILDEACATLRVSLDSKPDEIYDLEQKIVNIEIEINSLKEETDVDSLFRVDELKNQYLESKQELEELTRSWEDDKELVEKIVKLQENRQEIVKRIEDITIKQGYTNEVSELISKKNQIDNYIEKLEEIKQDKIDNGSILRSDVNHDSIAEAISVKTGIPVSRMLTEDKEKILDLPNVLSQRVIGQEEAINSIFKGILRSKSGIQNRKRPNSYMFLGASGTGKTELAKAVAEQLYDSEKNIVRIDMSEYMEKHNTSRLIGPPPGYVGYEEGGQLTEAVFRNPYSIILLDEIEKAHPDVLLTLLQVLDDGRLTDGKGRVIDFKNTLVIMTSNFGSTDMIGDSRNYGKILPETKERIRSALNSQFRPEFINRIDEIVFFNILTPETILKIVDKQLMLLNNRLEDELKIFIYLSKEVKKFIADNGYEPEYGARPLVRFFENSVETVLALDIMENKIEPSKKYIGELVDNKVVFTETF